MPWNTKIINHIIKVDMPSSAIDLIAENVDLTPSIILPRIQKLYPHITATQIHKAWSQMSKILWKWDNNQLESARLLLSEFEEKQDITLLELPVHEGMIAIGWSLLKIIQWIKGNNIIEIVMDATCVSQIHYYISDTNGLSNSQY